jgi:threonine dehydrogenase-like Zn-dependent dehydrogenase
MRSLVWDGKRATVAERPLPERKETPAQGPWALVRVGLAGVCATDLEITRGYMDFTGILGHEFVGRVEEGPEEWRGERVVGEINIACGACAACARDLGRHCPNRSVIGILAADGVFADYVALPVSNLHRVPEGVPDAAAVFCEPLAAAFEIREQIDVAASDRCVVFGDGRLGLLCAQVLRDAGADVLAVGKHPEKLALLEARGISTRLLSDWNAGQSERVDVSVEATGSSEGFARALAATRPRGTLVLKSTVADDDPIDLSPLVIDEIQLVGSRCGPFPVALEALAEGRVDVESLIHDRLPLSQADEALRRAAVEGVLKVLIDCG